jgi:hypothetical protein
VIFAVFANFFEHTKINPHEIADMQIDKVSDIFIRQITDDVLGLYKSLGGTNQNEKSSELVNSLKQSIDIKYSSKTDI